MTACTNVSLYVFYAGWIFGERLHDQERGWFPSSMGEEILNPKIRSQNLKECFRVHKTDDSQRRKLGSRKKQWLLCIGFCSAWKATYGRGWGNQDSLTGEQYRIFASPLTSMPASFFAQDITRTMPQKRRYGYPAPVQIWSSLKMYFQVSCQLYTSWLCMVRKSWTLNLWKLLCPGPRSC